MSSAMHGLIEGFYGRPWSWDERVEVLRFCHERGMRQYVYAPKDDAKHRKEWREPYSSDELDGFSRLVDEGTLEVAFAISPGLSIDYDDADDRAALGKKVDQLVDLGVASVCLALDDIPPVPGMGERHAALTTWLREHLDGRAGLVLVPTEYTSTLSSAYLDALAAGAPVDVPVAWTGPTVVCDVITVAQAEARAAALGGRPPLLWDNYPVNDGFMGDRLFIGPLRGREPGLAEVCSGWWANPMVQPHASLLPLASIAAFLRGDDPDAAWDDDADAMGVRTFAEACDGVHPLALVRAVVGADDGDDAAGPLAELAAWLDDAATCTATPFGEEVDRWVDQVHREAQVGQVAVDLLRAVAAEPVDLHRATETAVLLGFLWTEVRRGPVSAMGVRAGMRPVLSQGADGGWRYHRASLTEGTNAVDALCRHALDRLADAGEAAEASLHRDGC